MELIEQIACYSEHIEALGRLAMLVIFIAIVMQCHVPMIPFAIVAGVCGFLFGFLYGALLAWFSVVLGSFVAFNVFRFFKLDAFMDKILRKYKMLPKINDKFIIAFIVIAHNIPAIPIAIPNILAAMSKISVARFIFFTAAGLFIPCVLFAGFGAGLEAFVAKPGILTFIPILLVVSFLLLLKFIDLEKFLSAYE